MDNILTNIKDPGWWFSAVFIAIIASVIAGFTKDRIERWLGQLSSRARGRQQRHAADREKAVRVLAENEAFLILSMIRAGILAILFSAVAIMFMLSPLLVETARIWCTTVPEDPSCAVSPNYLFLLAHLCFGLLTIVFGYHAASTLSVTMRGFTAYRIARGLPRIG